MNRYLYFSIAILLLSVSGNSMFAQHIVNHGAKINITAGACVRFDGNNGSFTNLTNGAEDGTLYLSGILDVKGNWYNDAANGVFDGTVNNDGTISFTGDTNQIIGGNTPTFFENLTVSKSGGELSLGLPGTVVSGNLQLSSLLRMGSNITLTVHGNTSLNSPQCLIIHSGPSSTGSFINYGSMGGAGSACIERYITSSVWHYVSPSISSAIAGVFSGQYLKRWNESNYSWTNLTNTGTLLNVMKGYALYSNLTTVFNYIGMPNSGAISLPVTRNTTQIPSKQGWNLMGNPYPSSIDWDAPTGWTKTNINNATYIYNQVYANYATYVAGIGVNGGSRYISPSQGFFVVCNTPAGGTLGMNNNVRVHQNTPFLKDSKSGPTNFVRLRAEQNGLWDETVVRLDSLATQYFDGMYDAYKLLGMNLPQISSTTFADTTTEYAINTVGFAPVVTIPVNLYPADNGIHSITASELNSFDPFITVYLEDLLTGTVTNLMNNPVYTFNGDTNYSIHRFLLHFNICSPDSSHVTIGVSPSDSICAGEIISFNAQATNGGANPVFNWLVNGQPAGAVGNTYTILALTNGMEVSCVMTSSDSCVYNETSTSNIITLTVFTPPSPPVIHLSGDSLHSSASAGNQWFFNGTPLTGETASYLYPLQNGNYYSIVTSPEGCTSDTSNNISVLITAFDDSRHSEFTIIPNPSDGLFMIESSYGFPEFADISIYSMSGSLVYSCSNCNTNKKYIDLRCLNQGLYLVRVSSENFTGSSKLIIH